MRTGTDALVAAQVLEHPLGELPSAVDGVHDLQVLRVARDRAQQPAAPVACLVGVAGGEQRLEGERCVAQPAVAVVPVALAAEVLGQARGRRSHDAARLGVGQHAEREQAAAYEIGMGDVVDTAGGPALVLDAGRLDPVVEGERFGQGAPGPDPGRGERHHLAGGEVELVDVPAVRGAGQARTAEHQLVGTGRGDDDLVAADLLPRHPGPDPAVVEADDPLVAHPDGSLRAADGADQVCAAVAHRHHVPQHQHPGGRAERGLEDRAVADVLPGRRHAVAVGRCEQPAAVVARAQQRGEAGR